MPTDLENFIFSSHDPSISGISECTDIASWNTDIGTMYACQEWSHTFDGTIFYNITFFVLTVVTVLQVIRFFFSRVRA